MAIWVVSVLLTVLSLDLMQAQNSVTPVEVDVYYESLCPDSRRYFLKQLCPTYEKIGSDIKLQLIPYGNAEVKGHPGKWKFTCQHGSEECYGNIIQTCAIEIMNTTLDSLKFVVCAFNTRSQKESLKECIRSSDLRDKIDHCANGTLGNDMEYKMAKKTEALDPPQTFIPWTTVNGKGSKDINGKTMDDLFDFLCQSYKGAKPSACNGSRRKRRSFHNIRRTIYW